MADHIVAGPIHHLRMTVTDVNRSRAFYTGVLGFEVAAEMPPSTDNPVAGMLAEALLGGIVLRNGDMLMGLRPVPSGAAPGDRFDENRVGLDHISFSVGSRADLERAAQFLDERGVTHGEIKDLTATFGIYVLAFRDPDNIQLELTAPAGT